MELNLTTKFKSLEPLSISLPSFTILTGVNGAGKTQILASIMDNKASVRENGAELTPKKYITHQTLSPNDSNIITRQSLLKEVDDIWKPYKQFQDAIKSGRNHVMNQFVTDPNKHKLLEDVAKKASKNVKELSQDDIYLYYPVHQATGDVFYQNFSNLFKRYQDKYDDNRYKYFLSKEYKDTSIKYLTEEEFTNEYGEAPWGFVNKIIKEASLDYHINSPIGVHRDAPFELKLINDINEAEVKFSDLSSGEKVLMSLALALYNAKYTTEFPKILLMDEPDASLHPSMAKQFLDVVQNVFVKDKGVKVIMTTHSPSTVAMAPEESIYVVNKTGHRIEKTSKDNALKILTSGVPSFSVNYENRRQVFVESKYDVIFYDKIYDKIKNKLTKDISLSFISSGVAGIGNCDQVVDIVNKLTEHGNRFIFGIIDWDKKNKPQNNILVVGQNQRYSLENYIFDPILISAFLLSERLLTREQLELSNNESYADFKNLSSETLQIISNKFLEIISHKFDTEESKHITAEYSNGISIEIPSWYLHHQGHSLETKLKEHFPQLNKYNKEEALKKEIINKIIDDLPCFISMDIINTFQQIQEQY